MSEPSEANVPQRSYALFWLWSGWVAFVALGLSQYYDAGLYKTQQVHWRDIFLLLIVSTGVCGAVHFFVARKWRTARPVLCTLAVVGSVILVGWMAFLTLFMGWALMPVQYLLTGCFTLCVWFFATSCMSK